MDIKELEELSIKLKTGEYDGADLMKAWIAIEELITVKKCINGGLDVESYLMKEMTQKPNKY